MNAKIIFNKYGKLNLNIKELSELLGISKSKTEKMFYQFGEQQILDEKILPKWKKIGNTRLWNIHEIISWLDNTETVK